MQNILLAAILLLNTVFLIVAVTVTVRVVKIFKGFALPQAPGEPSALSKFVEASGDMVARSIVAQFKTTLLGMQSGAVRAEKAIAGDIAEDTLAASPLAALGAFPSVRKSLRRNPQLLDLAMQFLGPRLFGGNNGAAPDTKTPTHTQVKFNL